VVATTTADPPAGVAEAGQEALGGAGEASTPPPEPVEDAGAAELEPQLTGEQRLEGELAEADAVVTALEEARARAVAEHDGLIARARTAADQVRERLVAVRHWEAMKTYSKPLFAQARQHRADARAADEAAGRAVQRGEQLRSVLAEVAARRAKLQEAAALETDDVGQVVAARLALPEIDAVERDVQAELAEALERVAAFREGARIHREQASNRRSEARQALASEPGPSKPVPLTAAQRAERERVQREASLTPAMLAAQRAREALPPAVVFEAGRIAAKPRAGR
jgi:hypothetical protein